MPGAQIRVGRCQCVDKCLLGGVAILGRETRRAWVGQEGLREEGRALQGNDIHEPWKTPFFPPGPRRPEAWGWRAKGTVSERAATLS